MLTSLSKKARAQRTQTQKRVYSKENNRYYLKSAILKDNHLEVNWGDGHQSKFHYPWLRMNCSKYKTTSDQRTILPSDLTPEMVAPLSAHVSEYNVVMKWTDGHHSAWTDRWLLDHCYSNNTFVEYHRKHTPVLWDKDLLTKVFPQFQYDKVLQDNGELWNFVKSLNAVGIAILRGAPTEKKTVNKIAERLGGIRNTMYGDEWDLMSMPNPNNVAYTSMPLPLHQDLCYYETPPGIQLLHCLRFDQLEGGHTLFSDGFKAATMLKTQFPDHFKTLKTVLTTYQKVDENHHFLYRRPIIHTNEKGDISGLFYSPPFEGPLFTSENNVEPYYAAYREFTNIAQSPELVFDVRLEPGDIIAFNNRRILHGRTSFDDQAGVRHMQGIYVDLDDFASTLRVLKRRHNVDPTHEGDIIMTRGGNHSY